MVTSVEQPSASVEPDITEPDVAEPRLSVVIACRGGAPDHLCEQLQSLATQDYDGDWELVIGDNGMSPGTRAVVDAFALRLPHMRVVDVSQRPGKGYAVNAAVAQARGSRLLLLDADDTVGTGYLHHIAEALRQYDFVGGRLDSTKHNAPWLRTRRTPMQEQRLETLLDYRPIVVGAAMAMSRDAFLAVGGFDEDLETQLDVDLSWRLQQSGVEPAFVPQAVVAYRYRDRLASLFRQERAYGRGEVVIYLKHRRNGIPPRRWRRTVRGWLDVALALPGVRHRAGRARLATVGGAALGRLEGSFRHRILYL